MIAHADKDAGTDAPQRQGIAMDVKPVTLEGAGVRMVPLTEAHESELLAILDPTLTQWFPKPLQTREDVRGYIAEALAWQRAGTALPFATVQRAGALEARMDCHCRLRIELTLLWEQYNTIDKLSQSI